MRTATCIAFRPRVFGSLRFMVPGAVPIWRSSFSPRPFWTAHRSSCSITATCGAISPTSTTSARRSCGFIDHPPCGNPQWSDDKPDPASSAAPWKIYNVGNNRPEELTHVVSLLEKEFGRTAAKEMVPMQPGDVSATYADVEDLAREIGFRPATRIEDGIGQFAMVSPVPQGLTAARAARQGDGSQQTVARQPGAQQFSPGAIRGTSGPSALGSALVGAPPAQSAISSRSRHQLQNESQRAEGLLAVRAGRLQPNSIDVTARQICRHRAPRIELQCRWPTMRFHAHRPIGSRVSR